MFFVFNLARRALSVDESHAACTILLKLVSGRAVGLMAIQCCRSAGKCMYAFSWRPLAAFMMPAAGSSEPFEKPKLYVRQHGYYGFNTVLYVTAISHHRAQRSLNGELK